MYTQMKIKKKKSVKENKLILKCQQRFRSKKHSVFTEEVNKIALSGNDAKRIRSIDSAKTYSYGRSKDLNEII